MFTCNNLGSVLQTDVQSQYSRNTGTVQALVWMIMICNIIDMKKYLWNQNILCRNLQCHSIIVIERWLTVWEASCLNDLISSVVASPSGTVLPLWKITVYLPEIPAHVSYLQNVFPLMGNIKKKFSHLFPFGCKKCGFVLQLKW